MGKLHFTDAEDNPIVILCFVQEQVIKGHDNFALICSDTLVDMKADINYHAETSKQGKILPLKRLISNRTTMKMIVTRRAGQPLAITNYYIA